MSPSLMGRFVRSYRPKASPALSIGYLYVGKTAFMRNLQLARISASHLCWPKRFGATPNRHEL